ncbi:hypothetical protein [Rhizobium esperanzae]|nr:hypothetical protein [Rhizobium esperanzae]
MRFISALAIAIISSHGGAVACPLDDTLKLCVLNGRSQVALHDGAGRGDWKVEAISSPVNATSEPRTSSEVYTMPNGQRFSMLYRDFQKFFSATCSLDYLQGLAENRLSCSNAELEAFEAGLSAASLGRITKERRQSGTAYLIEGQNSWLAVIVAQDANHKEIFNTWVEISVVKEP